MSKEIELANGLRNITKEWIEERMRIQEENKNVKIPAKTEKVEKKITAEIEKYWKYYDDRIAELKRKY